MSEWLPQLLSVHVACHAESLTPLLLSLSTTPLSSLNFLFCLWYHLHYFSSILNSVGDCHCDYFQFSVSWLVSFSLVFSAFLVSLVLVGCPRAVQFWQCLGLRCIVKVKSTVPSPQAQLQSLRFPGHLHFGPVSHKFSLPPQAW